MLSSTWRKAVALVIVIAVGCDSTAGRPPADPPPASPEPGPSSKPAPAQGQVRLPQPTPPSSTRVRN
jgi:hypothetical protein